MADQLFRGGRTAHSAFNMLVLWIKFNYSNVPAGSQLATEFQNVDLIIWDEIMMCSRHCIDTVDRTMPNLSRNRRPLGGRVVLFLGDVRQFLPVIEGSSSHTDLSCMCQDVSYIPAVSNIATYREYAADSLAKRSRRRRTCTLISQLPLQLEEGRMPRDEEEQVILHSSDAINSDFRSLCLLIFGGIERNYILDDWLTNCAIQTKKCKTRRY